MPGHERARLWSGPTRHSLALAMSPLDLCSFHGSHSWQVFPWDLVLWPRGGRSGPEVGGFLPTPPSGSPSPSFLTVALLLGPWCGRAQGSGLKVTPKCHARAGGRRAAPLSPRWGQSFRGSTGAPIAAQGHLLSGCQLSSGCWLSRPQPAPGAALISTGPWAGEPRGEATDTLTFVQQCQRQGGEVAELKERGPESGPLPSRSQ